MGVHHQGITNSSVHRNTADGCLAYAQEVSTASQTIGESVDVDLLDVIIALGLGVIHPMLARLELKCADATRFAMLNLVDAQAVTPSPGDIFIFWCEIHGSIRTYGG